MPSLHPGKGKVLVTGASGYIATWVAQTLLQRGYSVRGTVRSPDKGVYLQETFKSYGDKFEIAIVEDIAKEGAFDEAVKGVDAIEHVASPFHLKADDPQELIGPAVQGTVGILNSALKYGSSVQRIVITSSCASVLRVEEKPTVFSEVDWNHQSIKIVEEQGRNAPNIAKYRASKTLAELAAWDFYKKNKGSIKWDLVVLNPPFVFGPAIHEVKSLDSLNVSAADWANTVLRDASGGERKSHEELATVGSSWIDVRDLAEAHARALEKDAASGERIIISAGSFVWQDWVDVANSLKASPLPSRGLAVGNPGGGKNALHMLQYDATKADRILGLKYRTMGETTKDVLVDFVARGW